MRNKKRYPKMILALLCMTMTAPVNASDFTDDIPDSEIEFSMPEISEDVSPNFGDGQVEFTEEVKDTGIGLTPETDVSVRVVEKRGITYEYVPETDSYKVVKEYGYSGQEEVCIAKTIEGKAVTEIGAEAFVNYDCLKKIIIGENVTAISSDAFGDKKDFVISAPEGSFGESFAASAGIAYEKLICRKIGIMEVSGFYTSLGRWLNWSTIAHADGYEVYRYDSETEEYELYKIINDETRISLNVSADIEQNCYFKVRAFSDAAIYTNTYGEFSQEVLIKAKPETAVISSVKNQNDKIIVTWSQPRDTEGYVLFRSDKKDGTYKKIKTITDGSKISYVDTDVSKGKNYYYKVRSFRILDDGNRYYSADSEAVGNNSGLSYEYLPEKDSYKIIKGIDIEEIFIPGEYNGKPVVEIGEEAFKGLKHIKKVRISSGADLFIVGKGAFEGCVSLLTVNLPGYVRIEDKAFYNCPRLFTINGFRPDTETFISAISDSAFDPDTKVTATYMTGDLSPSLKEYFQKHGIYCVDIEEDEYFNVEGSSYIRMGEKFFYADCDDSMKSVIMSNSAEWVGRRAFYGCINVEKVLLSANIKTIETKAFAKCKNMEIVIPSSVTDISDDVFEGASGLTICTTRDSYAEKYAKEHGIKCKTFNVKRPCTPSLTVTYSGQKARLQWDKVDYATKYELYLYNSETKKYNLRKVLDSTRTGFTVSVAPASSQYFKIRAYSYSDTYTDKYSAYSKKVAVKGIPYPADIISVKNNKNGLKVSWKKAKGADGYIVYRGESKNGTYKKIRTITGGSILRYTDTSAKGGKKYYYKIRSFRKVNSSKRIYGSYGAALSN